MNFSYGFVLIFLFGLLAPPSLAVADGGETSLAVATQQDTGLEHNLEPEEEDSESEGDARDDFLADLFSLDIPLLTSTEYAIALQLYTSPFLNKNIRPPRS